MEKRYKSYEPEQSLLFPPNIKDWLPEGHLANFVSDVVDQLDLSEIEAVYEKDTRGQPPYNPRMMTKVLLYGYCIGVFSSRRIQTALIDEVPFRVLAAGNQPDFRTISDFRKIHHKALQALFQQVLRMALEAGAMKLGRVALDGSKVKANASKHKAMSYGRMTEKEDQLRQEVRALLKEADRIDSREDKLYGRNRHGDELPEELSRRETRLAKIREAKRALEERARERAKAEGKDPETAKPADKDQYNFTDSESRIMKGGDGFVQAYNAQAAVEGTFQLIVGQTVTQDANDKKQVEPMVKIIEAQAGEKPDQLLADSGYCSDKNLEYIAGKGIDAYIATEKQKHDPKEPKPKRGPLPPSATQVDRMRRKLQTQRGAAIYAARKSIVEPVFGQIKQGRGFRQFLLRGVEKVKAEWALVCLTHNILKMYRMCYG
ncbi:MAG: IS1182 family transposase [Acidobacteriota bacterium]|jgi:transposase